MIASLRMRLSGALRCTISIVTLCAALGASRSDAVTFPQWQPESQGWQTADGRPLVRTDGISEPNPNLTGQLYQRIGRLWGTFDASASGVQNAGWAWPGGLAKPFWSDITTERYGSSSSVQGAIVGARNWRATGSDGQLALSYITNEDFRYVADGYRREYDGDPLSVSLYGRLELAQVQRWLPPQVIVNGVRYIDHTDTYDDSTGSAPVGNGAANFGAVRGVLDPALTSERAVFSAWRFPLGVDVFQTVHAYGSPPDRDYLLYDTRIVNTGNIDHDSDYERSGLLDDFRYASAFSVDISRTGDIIDGGGDDIVEYAEPWPGYVSSDGSGKTLALVYDGDGVATMGPDWGAPGNYRDNATTLEPRLHAPGAIAVGWIYAETNAGSGVDDPSQPRTTVWSGEDTYSIVNLSGGMRGQYQRVFAAADYDPAFSPVSDTTTYRLPIETTQHAMGVPQFRTSVYQTLAYDEVPAGGTIHAVQVVAAGGLSDSLSRTIGELVAQRDADGSVSPDERMTPEEITLVRTNKDSALASADRAFWNIYGYDPNAARWSVKPAAQDMAYNVPDPPKPPGCIWVSASSGGRVDVTWTDDAESLPDHDVGTHDFAGYRVYRSDGSSSAPRRLIAELRPGVTSYTDSTVSRDEVYFYAVTTFDDGTANWARPGVSLESSPFWAWTGWDETGVRPIGRTAEGTPSLADVRVVPNPYHASAVVASGGRSGEVTWHNLPRGCTIRVYTSAGDFVHQLTYDAAADWGTLPWDLRTESDRLIATGVYVYVAEVQGDRKVGKFVVVQ
jgi:hypothetical protein